jgi:hypothetical protein
MTSDNAGSAVPSEDVKPAPSPAAATVKSK